MKSVTIDHRMNAANLKRTCHQFPLISSYSLLNLENLSFKIVLSFPNQSLLWVWSAFARDASALKLFSRVTAREDLF